MTLLGAPLGASVTPHHASPRRAVTAGARRGAVLLVTAVTLLATLLSGPAAVSGNHVPRIRDQVTDQTGRLSGGTARIQSALDRLASERNIQLFVLFVRTTGNLTAARYAEAVTSENDFGANDALLLVAVDDRTYAMRVSDQINRDVTPAEVDALMSGPFEAALRGGDFPGAVVVAADQVRAAAGNGAPGPGTTTGPVATPVPTGGTVTPVPPSGGGGGGLGFLPILLLLGIGFGIYMLMKRGRSSTGGAQTAVTGAAGGAPAQPLPNLADLGRQANAMLIETDELLRADEQEIGFAEAQFSDVQVKPFRDALARAREELRGAFTTRQQLDDSTPEDDATRAAMLQKIIGHCERARAVVGEQRERLDQLRDLEKTAPDILAGLPAQADAVAARVPASEQALQGELAAAAADLAAARQQMAAGRVANLEPALSQAEAALETARREAGAARPDVLAAMKAANEANRLSDQVLAGVQEAEQRVIRERHAVESAIRNASAAYRVSEDYITARRWGVGGEARTRLAESRRHSSSRSHSPRPTRPRHVRRLLTRSATPTRRTPSRRMTSIATTTPTSGSVPAAASSASPSRSRPVAAVAAPTGAVAGAARSGAPRAARPAGRPPASRAAGSAAEAASVAAPRAAVAGSSSHTLTRA